MNNQNDCPHCHDPWIELQRAYEGITQENNVEYMDTIEETQSSQTSRRKSKRNLTPNDTEEEDAEPGPSPRRRLRSPCF